MLLLQYFNELTLQPENAQKLKGLILELAVRGKLTQQWRQQNPDTPSAQQLLKAIKAEKKQLIAKKEIKKESPLPKIEVNEIPFDLPENWVWSRLGTVTHNLGQKKPDTDFLYIDVSAIDNEKGIIKDNIKTIPFADAPSRARKLVKKGTVIYSTVRPYLKNIAVIDKDFSIELIASTAFAILHPTTNYSSKYLFYYLRSFVFTEYVEAKMKGVAYPAINDKNFFRGLIAFPPLAEQKAIVKIVEQLFQEVENLTALTKQRLTVKEAYVQSILQNLETGNTEQVWQNLVPNFPTFFDTVASVKALRQTVLQLAVQGKLTTTWRQQNPNILPASELLKQIKTEKAALVKAKKIKTEKALPKISEGEIPFELPVGWVWARLNTLTKIITKGSSPKWQGISYVQSGVLFITSENVGNYSLRLTKKKYVEDRFNEIQPRSILEKNDILMNIVGASIGRTAVFDLDEVANINQAVTIIRLINTENYEYFLHFFNSPVCISYMYNKQVDNARPNLSMTNIAKFVIPIPPLAEQKAIVEKVEHLMGLCDALEAAIKEREVKRSALMNGSMRGVLVR
jgi:type I restriction enzyme S subunit